MKWKTITIKTSGGDRSVPAVVVGAWAAHERWNQPDGGWVVTHVKTGLALGFPGELTATEAIATACALNESGLADADEIADSHHAVEAIVARAVAEVAP